MFALVLKPVQGCLDMFAGAQAINAVIGAVAAVDWFCKGANLDTIGLSVVGVDTIDTEKIIVF